MKYALDIWDATGKLITPGFHPDGVMFLADSPIPVPNEGETLHYHPDKWRVNKRVFT